jgi:hypothetical protein
MRARTRSSGLVVFHTNMCVVLLPILPILSIPPLLAPTDCYCVNTQNTVFDPIIVSALVYHRLGWLCMSACAGACIRGGGGRSSLLGGLKGHNCGDSESETRRAQNCRARGRPTAYYRYPGMPLDFWILCQSIRVPGNCSLGATCGARGTWEPRSERAAAMHMAWTSCPNPACELVWDTRVIYDLHKSKSIAL